MDKEKKFMQAIKKMKLFYEILDEYDIRLCDHCQAELPLRIVEEMIKDKEPNGK